MVALKLKELLAEHGFEVQTVEASPGNIESVISGTSFDLMACVSPVSQDYGIPKVRAVGLLTGLEEEEVIEECLKVLSNLAE